MRSGGRVVEGARLESEYTPKAYRGFESLPLRQRPRAFVSEQAWVAYTPVIWALFALKPIPAACSDRVSAPALREVWPASLAAGCGVEFPCYSRINREFCQFEPQNRPFDGCRTKGCTRISRYNRGLAAKMPLSLLLAITGYVSQHNRGVCAPVTGNECPVTGKFSPYPDQASNAPILCACAPQSIAISAVINRSSVRVVGWRPARIMRWRSGARKARRTSRRR